MQLKNQARKNWKVVAAITAASAIGISGLALADPGDGSNDPMPIDLKDRTEITTQVTTATSFPGVTFNTLMSATDTNSPFDDTTTGTLDTISATASPDTASASPASASVSPDTASVSPDTASVSPDTASVSPDTATDSFDNSVDS